jgi:hypothetical protein
MDLYQMHHDVAGIQPMKSSNQLVPAAGSFTNQDIFVFIHIPDSLKM